MLKAIIKQFEDRLDLPVEVEEIAAAIKAAGCEDEIHFAPVSAETAIIHGVFSKFIYRPGVYADPVTVAHIPYNKNDSMEWQRVTCCKELVHLFDSEFERTDTEEEVPAFIEKLLGLLSTEDFSVVDLMAGKDKLAVYQALPLLLPRAALAVARAAVKSGHLTSDQIAERAAMPVSLVKIMLNEHWDTLNGHLEKL